MSNAKYIAEQIEEEKHRQKIIASIPKLPVDGQLYISLPKALRQLSVDDNYTLSDAHKCTQKLEVLIKPLLREVNGKFCTKDKEEREKIKTALSHLNKIKTHKMLEEYYQSISKILSMNLFWIRDITTWKWKSRNTYKQLKSLIEHLFCEYEVPEFLFQSWTDKVFSNSNNNNHIDWFLHIASGLSAKKLNKFPIKATNKMIHEFINTPFPGYSIDDAVRRAQVIGLGGSERLADAILMSRLRHNFHNNDFWTTVIQFFIGVPMLNIDEIGTIIDYVNDKKFVAKHLVINGKRLYQAEMPDFNIKGRSVQTLIDDTHAWHRELKKYTKTDMSAKWVGTGIETFTLEEGNRDKKNYRHYELMEITSARELHKEGSSMHHCVFSYLSSCVKGTCFIFSLKLFGTSQVTIEVRDNRAVQIRGQYNKCPDHKEISIITAWAKKENLEISNYAIGGR